MLFLEAKAFLTHFQPFRRKTSTLPQLILIADALMNYSPYLWWIRIMRYIWPPIYLQELMHYAKHPNISTDRT